MKLRMQRPLPVVILLVGMGALGAVYVSQSRSPAPTWEIVKGAIRAEFPGVAQITTSALARRLAGDKGSEIILLDARQPEEYAVSHLRGARLAADESQALRALAGAGTDTRIVTYCSVGYRSAALAERLMANGFNKVENLEGSLFEWANKGLPVYSAGREVRRVHPFDKVWGQLLERELWSTTAGP